MPSVVVKIMPAPTATTYFRATHQSTHGKVCGWRSKAWPPKSALYLIQQIDKKQLLNSSNIHVQNLIERVGLVVGKTARLHRIIGN